MFDNAEREFRSFLIRELVNVDDAATPAKAAKAFKLVSPKEIRAFVEDQLETRAWWYEKPATATSVRWLHSHDVNFTEVLIQSGAGVAASWLMLKVFGLYLKTTEGSLIDFESMGPPGGALALCAVAVSVTAFGYLLEHFFYRTVIV